MKEILKASYWEHYKWAKECHEIYPIDHPKRIKAENALNEIISKMKLS